MVGRCRCAKSCCDLDLSFDLAVVTLTYNKFCPDNISETVRCRTWSLVKILVGVVGVQHCGVTLNLPLKLL